MNIIKSHEYFGGLADSDNGGTEYLRMHNYDTKIVIKSAGFIFGDMGGGWVYHLHTLNGYK